MREGNKPRVLVVDDGATVGRSLTSMMALASSFGYPCSSQPMILKAQAEKHTRHQGAKERAKRLKRLQRG